MVRFKFKSKKLGIDSVIQNSIYLNSIYHDVRRLHLLNVYVSHFVKFYCLESYDSNIEMLDISNKNTLYKFYSVFITNKCKEPRLLDSWSRIKSKIPAEHLVGSYFSGLSNHCNDYCSLQYSTLVKNNILMNYTIHVNHFVRVHFKHEIDMYNEIKDKEEKQRLRKYLSQQMQSIVQCLLDPSHSNNGLGGQYLSFLEQHRPHFKLFLSNEQRDQLLLSGDSDETPGNSKDFTYMEWLKTMIYMSQTIELHCEPPKDTSYKLLQVIPLYSKLVPGNVMFDSRCLAITCDLYTTSTTNPSKFTSSNIHDVWNTVFKTTSKSWKFGRNYRFTCMCQTDGVSITLQYIHQDEYDSYTSNKIKRGKLGAVVKMMSDEEREKYKQERNAKNQEYKLEQAKKRKEYKKQTPQKALQRNGIFYIDAIDKNILSTRKKVYIDPGHHTLMAMIDDYYSTTMTNEEKKNHQFMYRKSCRRHACGMNTRAKETVKRMYNNPKIIDFQKEMSKTRRKSSVLSIYNGYLDVFFSRMDADTLDFFAVDTWWRYQKLRSYGLTKKHEDKTLNSIESLFGKDAVYIIGDHSVCTMRGLSSSKGVGLKRLLQSKFAHVYHIDEYNTSKLYWKTHLEGEQWYSKEARSYQSDQPKKTRRRGKGVEPKRYKNKTTSTEQSIEIGLKGRRIHALKKFQTSNKLSVCINRDLNAVLNMKYITQYFIDHGTRPIEYCRKTIRLEGPV